MFTYLCIFLWDKNEDRYPPGTIKPGQIRAKVEDNFGPGAEKTVALSEASLKPLGD